MTEDKIEEARHLFYSRLDKKIISKDLREAYKIAYEVLEKSTAKQAIMMYHKGTCADGNSEKWLSVGCPSCSTVLFEAEEDYLLECSEDFKYCPKCGQKLMFIMF